MANGTLTDPLKSAYQELAPSLNPYNESTDGSRLSTNNTSATGLSSYSGFTGPELYKPGSDILERATEQYQRVFSGQARCCLRSRYADHQT